jgi:tetratricopeptide (TPR) repeat protein
MNKHLIWILALCLGCAGRSSRPQHADDTPEVTPSQLYEHGVALGRAGDYLRAEQYIEAAIERGYAVEKATPALVRVCVLGSQLRAALRYAEPQLLRNPADSSLRYLVATIHFGLDHPVKARDELTLLTELDPGYAEAHYLLGILARDAFATRDAAWSHFRRYLELEPHGTHASEAVAWLTQEPKRPEQAEGQPSEHDEVTP